MTSCYQLPCTAINDKFVSVMDVVSIVYNRICKTNGKNPKLRKLLRREIRKSYADNRKPYSYSETMDLANAILNRWNAEKLAKQDEKLFSKSVQLTRQPILKVKKPQSGLRFSDTYKIKYI